MIEFPASAKFGKRITLAQLKKQGASPRFAKWIKAVVWSYKLAPSTINLSASEAIREIEVLDVVLRDACSAQRSISLVVEMFSELIPNPCILRLFKDEGDEFGLAVCPKLSAGALYGDSPVFRCVLCLDSFKYDSLRNSLSGLTSLESYLIKVTATLSEMQVVHGESLKEFIARHYKLASLRADLNDIEKKIAKEVQFDFKYQLAKERQALEKEIQRCQTLNM